MKINKLIGIAFLLSGFSMPGFAQNAGGTVYVGGGVGFGSETRFCDLDDDIDEEAIADGIQSSTKCDETGLATKAFLGYRHNQYFAFEFAYSDVLGSEISNRTIETNGDIDLFDTEFSLERYGVDFIGFYPLNERFSALGKIGVSKNKFIFDATNTLISDGERESESDTYEEDGKGLLVGIGATFNIADVELRAIYERFWHVDTGIVLDSGKKLETDFSVLGLEAMMHFR